MAKTASCIGVDIESISRFKKNPYNRNKGFYGKIFTKRESNYCSKKKNPEKHFAARFAGKEAVIKAFLSLNKEISFKDIEIINTKSGSPIARLKKQKNYRVIISLAHCEDYAIAFASIN